MNHFIEIDKDINSGELWLLIHSGSRNLGLQVAKYYQKLAQDRLRDEREALKLDIIEQYKLQGHQAEIPQALSEIPNAPKDLEYLQDGNAKDYLHDMEICQEWAEMNRFLIACNIFVKMGWEYYGSRKIESVHNYIDTTHGIIRKGSISAQEDELCLIPLNMRDGTLICRGKGNPEWNYSAPHGAGRLMSRGRAKQEIELTDFEKSMEGIYSTTVNQSTIDESPFAYKDMEEIMRAIEPTVEILTRMVPIYNFKAST